MKQQSRRKVIKGLAISMPALWVTPVVESVILPAHAVVSGLTLSCESPAAPFGSSTPPGPTLDTTNGVLLQGQATVTPAPPDGTLINIAAYLAGSFIGGTDIGLVSGTSPILFVPATGVVGVAEARFTFQAETCSLFWNLTAEMTQPESDAEDSSGISIEIR